MVCIFYHNFKKNQVHELLPTETEKSKMVAVICLKNIPDSLPTTMPEIQSIQRKNKANSSPLRGQSQWDSWKHIWFIFPHSPNSSIWSFWDF